MYKETKGWRGRRELQTHNYDRTSKSTPKIAPQNILSADLAYVELAGNLSSG